MPEPLGVHKGELELEAGRDRGKQADFRFSAKGGDVFRAFPISDSAGISIEFEAIGLSDEETAFCQRARPTLEALRPPRGFITLHVPLDSENMGVWTDEARYHSLQEAIRSARREIPPHASGSSGAVVAAHGTEEAYVRRLRSRLTEALKQLPAEDECWVAFHWSNGAPFAAVHAAIDSIERPTHVVGILVVGSAIVFGHPEIHHFAYGVWLTGNQTAILVSILRWTPVSRGLSWIG